MWRRWYSTVFGLRKSVGRSFAGRPPLGEEQPDLQLLRCQRVEGARVPAARRLARRGELRRRLLRPRLGADPVEELDGSA